MHNELIVASCVRGYHVHSGNWITALKELYCEQIIGNVINQRPVAVKLTVRFAAAMVRHGKELENVPPGLGKVLLGVLKYEEN